MDRIDRYILALMAPPFFAALIGAMLLLMLERMLRVIDLVGESNGAIGYVFEMMASLVPHYLGLAVPAAFFVACFIAFRKLAQTSELAALSSIGRGLGRLALPAIVAALVLATLSSIVHSHMQPHGRYAYRTMKFVLANASIAQALQAGAFVEFGDVTFMAEPAPPGEAGLGRVFVHERRDDGSRRTVTSTTAALIEHPETGHTAVNFSEGLLVEQDPGGERAVVSFRAFDWPIDRDALGEFRPRGASEAEMTWPELFVALDDPPQTTNANQVAAEFHARIARAMTVLFVPLLAIPLAVAGGRTRSALPIAFGIVALLVYIQGIQFAEGLADLGKISAGLGVWSVFGVFFLGSLALFLRAWRGVGFELSLRLPRLSRRTREAPEAA